MYTERIRVNIIKAGVFLGLLLYSLMAGAQPAVTPKVVAAPCTKKIDPELTGIFKGSHDVDVAISIIH